MTTMVIMGTNIMVTDISTKKKAGGSKLEANKHQIKT